MLLPNTFEKLKIDPSVILLAYRGSISHNLYIQPEDPLSTDDIDIMGISVPGSLFYLGFDTFGSRETCEFWDNQYDIVVYECKKMLRMLGNANPNVLSILFLPDDMYIKNTYEGKSIINHRHKFLTKRIYNSFVGYAHDELERVQKSAYQGYMGEKRKKLVDQFGYDCRHASHCIRLLRMGIEALRTGNMTVFRTEDRDELLAIKTGQFKLEEIQKMADDLFNKSREALNRSTLPDAIDEEWLSKFCQYILMTNMGFYHAVG